MLLEDSNSPVTSFVHLTMSRMLITINRPFYNSAHSLCSYILSQHLIWTTQTETKRYNTMSYAWQTCAQISYMLYTGNSMATVTPHVVSPNWKQEISQMKTCALWEMLAPLILRGIIMSNCDYFYVYSIKLLCQKSLTKWCLRQYSLFYCCFSDKIQVTTCTQLIPKSIWS